MTVGAGQNTTSAGIDFGAGFGSLIESAFKAGGAILERALPAAVEAQLSDRALSRLDQPSYRGSATQPTTAPTVAGGITLSPALLILGGAAVVALVLVLRR